MEQYSKTQKQEAIPLRRRKFFTLQWHVTAKCFNNCAHCYLKDPEGYESEIKNELSLSDCFQIIDDFCTTLKIWNIRGRINFTGGDPLLKDGVIELIKYAKERDIEVGILGNGELLTSQTALILKEAGVSRYQVSIDGLEETHDRLRRKGSFRETLRGLRILKEVGIPSAVMFTVSKENIKKLIPVINLVAKEEVSIFDFARLVPIGKGAQFKDELIEPEEYRSLLLKVLEEYRHLKNNGCKTFFGRKDHLWKLLYKELGLFPPLSIDKETIFSGCSIGNHLIVIVADGTVYSCRRLPIPIGKFPEQTLREVFIKSEKLNELRQIEKMEKCSHCELLQYCRGCPAVAYGFYESYFAPDPQCWKKYNNLKEKR